MIPIRWILEGKKGYMAMGTAECILVRDASQSVINEIRKLPDDIEGQDRIHWTKLTIELER